MLQARAQLPLVFSPSPRPSPWNGATYIQSTPLTQISKDQPRQDNLLGLPFQVVLCYAKLTSDHPRTIPNLVILLLIRGYWCLSPGCRVCVAGPLTSVALSTSFQQPPVPICQFILIVYIWKLIHEFWFYQWCSFIYVTSCLCFGWFFKRRWEQCQLYDIVKLQVSHKSLKMVFLQLSLITFNVCTESKEAHKIPLELYFRQHEIFSSVVICSST